MKTIVIIWIASAFLSPIFVLLLKARYKKEQDRLASAIAEEDAEEEERSEEEQKILAILKASFRSISIQKGAGYGPWLSSLIERGGAEPDIALKAIQWTIRDILSAPISYDKDGREMPRRTFDLGGLYRAEAELMRIMGEGE